MKKILLVLFIAFSVNAFSQKTQKVELIKYLNQIGILNEETELQNVVVKNGDINLDKIPDMIFQYNTTIKHGSMKTGSGIVTYLKKNNKYIFSNDYQFSENYSIDTIVNNVLYVKEYFYKNTDPMCCPSIVKTKKIILKNNQLITIK